MAAVVAAILTPLSSQLLTCFMHVKNKAPHVSFFERASPPSSYASAQYTYQYSLCNYLSLVSKRLTCAAYDVQAPTNLLCDINIKKVQNNT